MPQIYPEDYSCILDPVEGCGGLYIGNLEAAQNINTLKKLQIKAVLTSAKGVELGHSRSDIPYMLYIPADDHQSFDLSKYFHQGANYINDCLRRTNIMVHCLAGVSRSVTLVLAYLIKHSGYCYKKAYQLVKARRRIIHPNEGFIQQLQRFQRQVSVCEAKSLSSSPSRSTMQRENSLSFSPTKRYTPSQEVEAILSKYENYKTIAMNYGKKNPQIQPQLKKIQSYSPETNFSPEKSHFRAKRVASMNVDRNELYESRNEFSSIKRYIIRNDYNPLESIQNKPSQVGLGVTDLDKKIQQIRRKYQEYQTPSISNQGRYSSNTNYDENNGTRFVPSTSGFDRDYLKYMQQRKQQIGNEVNSTRLKRLTSFQQY